MVQLAVEFWVRELFITFCVVKSVSDNHRRPFVCWFNNDVWVRFEFLYNGMFRWGKIGTVCGSKSGTSGQLLLIAKNHGLQIWGSNRAFAPSLKLEISVFEGTQAE